MSSAGRCIARSTSSGMVVGPGIARNSRPARTTIVLFLVDCPGKGMPGNAGEFKREGEDNRLKRRTQTFSILRDAAQSAAPQDEVQDPHGEERGNAARLEPSGHRTLLPPRFAAAGVLGVLHRAEPARALADMHLDLAVPDARRLVVEAFAAAVYVPLIGTVG